MIIGSLAKKMDAKRAKVVSPLSEIPSASSFAVFKKGCSSKPVGDFLRRARFDNATCVF